MTVDISEFFLGQDKDMILEFLRLYLKTPGFTEAQYEWCTTLKEQLEADKDTKVIKTKNIRIAIRKIGVHCEMKYADQKNVRVSAAEIMQIAYELERTGRQLLSREIEAGLGGYINKHGVRVPNPCGEIDGQGRNMDKVYRNFRPCDKLDEETKDRYHEIYEDVND